MGLESEWRANITIGGTTAEPEIGGTATVAYTAILFLPWAALLYEVSQP